MQKLECYLQNSSHGAEGKRNCHVWTILSEYSLLVWWCFCFTILLLNEWSTRVLFTLNYNIWYQMDFSFLSKCFLSCFHLAIVTNHMTYKLSRCHNRKMVTNVANLFCTSFICLWRLLQQIFASRTTLTLWAFYSYALPLLNMHHWHFLHPNVVEIPLTSWIGAMQMKENWFTEEGVCQFYKTFGHSDEDACL